MVAAPTWDPVNFEFKASLPYKTTEFPNTDCWPANQDKLQKEWKERTANLKDQSFDNAIIQYNFKVITKKLTTRKENPGDWIQKITPKTMLRSMRAQLIDEEFKAQRLYIAKDGYYGLCYSCGGFHLIDSLTAEHVQPKNKTAYSIVKRQLNFLKKFIEISGAQRDEILKKTRAQEYIIVCKKDKLETKKDIIIGTPIKEGESLEDKTLEINELFLRSYLNDMSNLICLCGSCNKEKAHGSMENKLRAYPLLKHEKAQKAFDFALNDTDIMYTTLSEKEGLGHAIIRWVTTESSLFKILFTQFHNDRMSSLPNVVPLTPEQAAVKSLLIASSPEHYKDKAEENIEGIIRGMKEMGISENAVQRFLLEQWNGPKAKRALFSPGPSSSKEG